MAVSQHDRVFNNKEAGIQFTLPKGWQAEEGGANINVNSPDNSIIYLIQAVDSDKIDNAIDATFKLIDNLIQDQHVTNKGKEGELNGLYYWEAEGKGTIKSVKIDWDVHIMVAQKPIIFIGIYFPDSPKDAKELTAFINSIKKSE
jgi:hypothetical protein